MSHAFPFGSAIVDAQIAGDSEYNQKYQDCFYTHFNWAVHENAMKWKTMERNQVGDQQNPQKFLIVKTKA